MLVGSIAYALASHCMAVKMLYVICSNNKTYERTRFTFTFKIGVIVLFQFLQLDRYRFVERVVRLEYDDRLNVMASTQSMAGLSEFNVWEGTFIVGMKLRVNTSNMRDTDDNSLRRAKINNKFYAQYNHGAHSWKMDAHRKRIELSTDCAKYFTANIV